MPVVITRVVIDSIIMDNSDALLPDFGMNNLTNWIASFWLKGI